LAQSTEGDASGVAAGSDRSRAWLRVVDEHSGIHDVVGPVDEVARMTATVTRCLEGGRVGTRFPLLRLVSRKPALSGEECDALGREIARLRALLGVISVETAAASNAEVPPAAPTSDPALAAAAPLSSDGGAATSPAPFEPFPRWNGSGAPRTLADLFAWPLHVLEHVAKLGAASRRGARFEVAAAGSYGPAARDRIRTPNSGAPIR